MVDEDVAAVAETVTHGARAGAVAGDRSYLLVIENASSWTFTLPATGAVVIGRGPEAELRLHNASVSRAHTRLLLDHDAVRVYDLESHNGTRVNGEPIVDTRSVTTGDVITIGEVVLVVHTAPRPATFEESLDEPAWRRRLAAEVERAVAFRRPLAIAVVTGADRTRLALVTRTIDVLGRSHLGEHLLLFPETDAADAARMVEVIARGGAKVGVASCPFDAVDPDSLVIAGRAALGSAEPVGRAADAVERFALGEREILVGHPAMAGVLGLLKRLAAVTLPVLIYGETGVGKENAAYAVHHYSRRAQKPFVAVNCAALPEQLIESELFGHDRGAFTGAVTARDGLLASVDGGTLFLDEVGELSLAVQAKLLRALETQRITRVGEHHERPIDVRCVAATNRDLEAEIAAGRFRSDLFFRLSGAKVFIPPLRERRCEIPLLFRRFLAVACARAGRPPPHPTPLVMQTLLAHAWPGNVRELVHLAEYLAALVIDDQIELDDLPAELIGTPKTSCRPPLAAGTCKLSDEIAALERRRIAEALAATDGVKTRAALAIGMPLRTFNMKVKLYGLG